jgi:hypothetical protein
MKVFLVLILGLFLTPAAQGLTKYVCRGIHGNSNFAIHRIEHGDFRVLNAAGKATTRILGLSPRRTLLQMNPQLVTIDLVPEEGESVGTIVESERGVTLIWNKLEFSCRKQKYQ